MITIEFYWAPEGRVVAVRKAESVASGRAAFKREFRKTYGKFMGEVYTKVREVSQ